MKSQPGKGIRHQKQPLKQTCSAVSTFLLRIQPRRRRFDKSFNSFWSDTVSHFSFQNKTDWEERSNRGARTGAADRTSLSFIWKARFPAILHACFPAILRARRQKKEQINIFLRYFCDIYPKIIRITVSLRVEKQNRPWGRIKRREPFWFLGKIIFYWWRPRTICRPAHDRTGWSIQISVAGPLRRVLTALPIPTDRSHQALPGRPVRLLRSGG